jgi:hypothetical protein
MEIYMLEHLINGTMTRNPISEKFIAVDKIVKGA